MAELLARLSAALSDRYGIERELGHGGMAVVFLARDLKHHRAVAVKVLRPELAAAVGPERFLREIEIAAQLTHPHILPLHDSGEADGLLFYVMPYVAGESLRDRLARERQLPVEEALRITREVGDALGYAHALGFVHRDIKPENILFQAGHALVSDFGIARAVSAAGGRSLTETGLAVGTPSYMSPEQAAGEKEIDARSDLYSLGCVLFEMLAGVVPYAGPTPMAVLAKKLSEPTPRISAARDAATGQVEAALMRVLAKVPADRYATAAEFVAALEPWARVEPVRRPWRRPRLRLRRRWVVVAGAVVLLAVAGGLAGRAGMFGGGAGAQVTVVLGALESAAADTSLGPVVATALETSLLESRHARVLGRRDLGTALHSMGRDSAARLDEATAVEVALRSGSAAAVVPKVQRLGASYILSARIVGPDGTTRAIAEARADDSTRLVPALDAMARDLRGKLGESRAALQASPSLMYALTPSLEALRALARGVRLSDAGRLVEPVALFEQAVSLDTNFAAAWVWLTSARANAGLEFLVPLERALALRDRLTPDRALEVEVIDLAFGRRDYMGLVERIVPLAESGSREIAPGISVYAGLARMEMGDPAQATAGFERATRFEGDSLNWIEWGNLALCAAQLADSAGVERNLARVRTLAEDDPASHYYFEAFAWTTNRNWSWVSRHPLDSSAAALPIALRQQLSVLLGTAAAVRGRPQEAEALFAEATELARHMGQPEQILLAQVQRAEAQFFALGDPERAARTLDPLLAGNASEQGTLRRNRARARALGMAVCAVLLERAGGRAARDAVCGAPLPADSSHDAIEYLEALGWRALHAGRYAEAVRLGREPQLIRGGSPGLRARIPAAVALERLQQPDSAAVIYELVSRASFGLVGNAPSAFSARSFALQRLARLGGARAERARREVAHDWDGHEASFRPPVPIP